MYTLAAQKSVFELKTQVNASKRGSVIALIGPVP